MIGRIAAFCAVAFALASCQQTEQINEMSYSELKALSLELHKRCWAEGAKSNTPEMNMCLQQEFTRESSQRQNALQARQAMGAALIANGQAYNAAMTAPVYRPVTCTSTPSSTWVGGSISQVRTNCY